MDLYLLDENRKPIAIVDSYISLVWTERYQDIGDFELDVKANDWSMNDFKPGRYLAKSDSDDTMIINSRELSWDAEEGNCIVIAGKSITSILDRRINISKYAWIYGDDKEYVYTGDISQVAKDILTDEFIDPKISEFIEYEAENYTGGSEAPSITYANRNKPKEVSADYRKIPEISLGDFSNMGIEITYECTKTENVLDIMQTICKDAGVGFKLVLDNDTRGFVFYIYKGLDRTLSQYDRTPLYFSEEMSNLIYSEYFEDESTWKNVVYSQGSDGKADYGAKGYTRASDIDEAALYPDNVIYSGYTEVWNGVDKPTGLNRREVSYDSDVSLDSVIPEGEEEGSGKIFWIEKQCQPYSKAVADAGKNYLKDSEIARVVDATGEIDLNVMYSFGIDYFLGDKVEFDTGFGVNEYALIDEVVYSYDSNGITVTPNFNKIEEEDE